MNRRDQRQRLFDLYSTNWTFYSPDCSGCFVCPICCKVFDRKALANPPQVSFAHIYPEACGYNVATLTCRNCNSHCGHEFDRHLATDHELWNAMTYPGGGTVDTRLEINGLEIGATVSRDETGFAFTHIERQTNPANVRALKEQHAVGGEIRAKFSVAAPDPKRHTLALLNSAYLAAFFFFGYEYVLFTDSNWIRIALLRSGPPEAMPLHVIPLERNESTHELRFVEECRPAVGFVRIDKSYVCLGVALPNPDKSKLARVVLLPSFGPRGKADYEAVLTLQGRMTTEVNFRFDDAALRLGDSRYKAFGRLWAQSVTF